MAGDAEAARDGQGQGHRRQQLRDPKPREAPQRPFLQDRAGRQPDRAAPLQSVAEAGGVLQGAGHPLHGVLVPGIDGFATVQGRDAVGHREGGGQEPAAGVAGLGDPEGLERHSEDGESGTGQGEFSVGWMEPE